MQLPTTDATLAALQKNMRCRRDTAAEALAVVKDADQAGLQSFDLLRIPMRLLEVWKGLWLTYRAVVEMGNRHGTKGTMYVYQNAPSGQNLINIEVRWSKTGFDGPRVLNY
jgi:hypothetical protein